VQPIGLEGGPADIAGPDKSGNQNSFGTHIVGPMINHYDG